MRLISLFVVVCVFFGNVCGDQTSKVYEADFALVGVKGIFFIEGRDNAKKYLDKIFNDSWFKQNYKIRKPVVIREPRDYLLESGIGSTIAGGRGTISVPDKGCYNFNMIHEVAHHIRPHGQHEREFTKMYLILIEHFTNPNVANELRKNYKRFGVQF